MKIETISELKELIAICSTQRSMDESWKMIYFYIGRGRKIEAIKEYRSMTGTGVRECKTAIEKIMETLPNIPF